MRVSHRVTMHFLAALLLVLLSQGEGLASETLQPPIRIGWTWADVLLKPSGTDQEGVAVVVSGADVHLAEPGEPDLPARLVRILAPEGSRPATYEIANATTRSRPCADPIRLAREWLPDGSESIAPFDGKAISPMERVRYLGLQLERGAAFATFAIYPILIEDRGDLSLLEDGYLELTWTADPTVPIPLQCLRPAAQAARNLRAGRTYRPPAEGRPSLLSEPVDYLILTTAGFADSLRPLVDWKNRTGTPAAMRTVEWVLANYPDGVDAQDRIRRFLIEAYAYWGTKWLLIAAGPDLIPTRTVRSYAWNCPEGVEIITDLYYGCLDGNWDANGNGSFGEGLGACSPVEKGDAVDFAAELVVGRIPAESVHEVSIWMRKYLAYLREPPTDGTLDRMLLMGEVLYPENWTREGMDPDCYRCRSECPAPCVESDGAESCIHAIQIADESPGVDLSYIELYEGYEYWNTNGRPNAQLESEASVIEQLNVGAAWVHHAGHGSPDRWMVGTVNGRDGLGTVLLADGRALENRSRTGVYFSISCEAGAFDGDCLAEAFIFAPDGGAIGYIGATNLNFVAAGDQYAQDICRAVFHDRRSIGEGLTAAIQHLAGGSDRDGINRFVAYSLTVLGDPQLTPWLGSPDSLAVEVPTAYSVGDSLLAIRVSRSGTPLAHAVVCASKEDLHESIHAAAATDDDGLAVVPFRSLWAGDFTVAVTHREAIPYQNQGRIPILAPVGWSLSVTGIDVSDGPPGNGNENGVIDEGETVFLDLAIRNGGAAPASGIANLQVGPESYADHVEVLDGDEEIPAVMPGEELVIPRAFRLRLIPPIPASLHQNGDRLPLVAELRLRGREQPTRFDLPLPAYRPMLEIDACSLLDSQGGDGDSIPEVGEIVDWIPTVRSVGEGTTGLTAVLEGVRGLTVLDSESSLEGFGEDGALRASSPLRFLVEDETPRGRLKILSSLDPGFVFFDREIDFSRPGPPDWSGGTQEATGTMVLLGWGASVSPDVEGYLVERAVAPSGEYRRVTASLVRGSRVLHDPDLVGTTRYLYRVTAVDSSGNAGIPSAPVSLWTNPALLTGWPFSIAGDMGLGSPTIENLDGDGPYEIFLGADRVYGLRDHGTEILDGDHDPSTSGPWSALAEDIASKPAIADIDRDGEVEVVVAARCRTGDRTGCLFVWGADGELRWSHPFVASSPVFGSPLLADIAGDERPEIIAQDRGCLFAWDAAGEELIHDSGGLFAYVGGGDPSDPGTWPYAYGSPAAADLDGDGLDEIVFGVETADAGHPDVIVVIDGDGQILAVSGDLDPGSEGPRSSISLGELDGDGAYEILWATRDALSCVRYDSGAQTIRVVWTYPLPSPLPAGWICGTPAIGNIDHDSRPDIVLGSGGLVLAVDIAGRPLDGFPMRVADVGRKLGSAILVNLDGDGPAEIVIGDDAGVVHAVNGDGSPVAGFPYVLGGRIQQGLACWDVDRDGHPNLICQAQSNRDVSILDITTATFPPGLEQQMAANPWPSFRHDARNTGRIDAHVITPVTSFELAAAGEPGAAVLRWSTPAEAGGFRIFRQGAGGEESMRAAGSADRFAEGSAYVFRDPSEPGRFTYRVHAYDEEGNEIAHSYAAEVSVPAVPAGIIDAAPNPSLGSVRVRFSAHARTPKLEILDLAGRRVRILAPAPVSPAGVGEALWDGRDGKGRPVGDGVYWVVLSTNGTIDARKVVLLR